MNKLIVPNHLDIMKSSIYQKKTLETFVVAFNVTETNLKGI